MSIIRKNGNGRYSEAVIHNGVIYIAGQVGDPSGSVAEQTADILATLDAILAENGSDKEHILQASVYMADVSHVAEMNAVWDKWVVPGKEPARVCCQAPLVSPAYKVEITLVAAVKE